MTTIDGYSLEFEVQIPAKGGWNQFMPRITDILRATCIFDPSHQDVLAIFSPPHDSLDDHNHARILRGDYRKMAVKIFQKE